MKLEMELKPKDIALLKLLGCVLIAFFMIRFLIFPGVEKHMDLAEQRENAVAQQEEMQTVMDRAGTLDAKIAKQQEVLNTTKKGYYDVLENRQVDELITGIVLNHSLFPVYLNITDTTPGVPDAYVLAAQNTDAASDTTQDTETSAKDVESAAASAESAADDDSGDETTTRTVTAPYVQTTSVEVTVQGSETEIRAFLDDIANNYPGIQVTAFTMQESSYVNSSLQTVSEMSCNCTLAVYTCGEQQ